MTVRRALRWLRWNARSLVARADVAIRWHTRRSAGSSHGLPAALVVSLTSYPGRFATVHHTVRCLLRQTVRPDRIILWVGVDARGALPGAITALEAHGLEVRVTPDIGPYTKLIPSLRAFPDAFVATADDDIWYGSRWLEDLVAGSAAAEHRDVVCHRAHRVRIDGEGRPLPYGSWDHEIEEPERGPLVFPTGVGGVLYPPGLLSPVVEDEGAFVALSPKNDDLWVYWAARRTGTLVRKVGRCAELVAWIGSQKQSLYATNVVRNDLQIEALYGRYGLPLDRAPQGRTVCLDVA